MKACQARRVYETKALTTLLHFRKELYDDLGLRQDSLFELVDAVLTSPQRSTLVRLSLCPVFRRRWPSTCDALADGSVETPKLRSLFARSLPESATIDGRPLWVIDGTNWPRPAARASGQRTWEYRPLPGWPQNGVVPAWAYQWMVGVPDVAGSWVLPLDVQRRGPTACSATHVALEQIANVREAQGSTPARPVVTLDSGYDLETLAQADVDADLLVRLARHRVVYRTAESYGGRGRPRLHGAAFRLADEDTHGQPQRSIEPVRPPQLRHRAYRRVDRSPRRWCARCSIQCDPRPSRAAAEQTAPPSTVVAGVDRRTAACRPERTVAVVPAPLYGRTCIPLSQADPGLDHRTPAPPKRSRSLDLARRRRLLATVAGPPTANGGPTPLGTPARGWIDNSRPGTAALQSTFGPGGYSNPSIPTSWKIPRTQVGTASIPSNALRSGSPRTLTSCLTSRFICPKFNA